MNLFEVVVVFWPNGWWGGYAKFFEPKLPSRIGDVLSSNIHNGLKNRSLECIDKAIDILSKTQLKKCGSQFIGCYPTKESAEAIKLLNTLRQFCS